MNSDGLNIIEINDQIIEFLTSIKNQEITVIAILSEDVKLNRNITKSFMEQGSFQGDLNDQGFYVNNIQGVQLLSHVIDFKDKKIIFVNYSIDFKYQYDGQGLDQQAIELFLIYLISSVTIFPLQNQESLKRIVSMNQKLYDSIKSEPQGTIQQIQRMLQKQRPKLLMVQDCNNVNRITQQNFIYDLVEQKLELKQVIQFGRLFKKESLLKTSLSSLNIELIDELLGLKSKKIGNFRMSGEILLEMILNFLENLNTNKSIVRINGFGLIEGSQSRKKLDKVMKDYKTQILDLTQKSKIEGKILLEEELLDLKHRELFQKILNSFDDQMKQLSNSTQVNKDRKDLINKITNDYENLTDKNYEESKEFCSELMHSYQEIFRQESQNLEDLIENKDVYIKEKSANFEQIMQGYLGDAVGPFKYRTVSDNIPSFLFEMFDQWFEGLNSYYMSDLNKVKAHLMQTQETLAQSQISCQDSDVKRYEIEDQYIRVFYDLENQKREVDNLMKSKQIQEEVSEQRISEYKKKYENQKEKKKNMKEKYERQSNEIRSFNVVLQEKKKELSSYLLKIDQLEKALEQTMQQNQKKNSLDSVEGLQEELLSLLKQFKENLVQAEDQIKKQRESVNLGSSRVSINQDKTYQKLVENNEKQIKKYKDLKEKIIRISDEKEDIEKKNHQLENQVNELENRFKYIVKSQEEKSIKQINDELQRDVTDIVKKTTQDQQDFLQVLLGQKQQQEQLSNENQELQLRVHDQSCKVSDLSSQKLYLITILREVIKMTQNKPNTLYNIVNSLPLETQQEIKEILRNAGIKQKNS